MEAPKSALKQQVQRSCTGKKKTVRRGKPVNCSRKDSTNPPLYPIRSHNSSKSCKDLSLMNNWTIAHVLRGCRCKFCSSITRARFGSFVLFQHSRKWSFGDSISLSTMARDLKSAELAVLSYDELYDLSKESEVQSSGPCSLPLSDKMGSVQVSAHLLQLKVLILNHKGLSPLC